MIKLMYFLFVFTSHVFASEYYFFYGEDTSSVVYFEKGRTNIMVFSEKFTVVKKDNIYTITLKKAFLLNTESGRVISLDSFKTSIEETFDVILNGRRVSVSMLRDLLLKEK
ncbi:MAG: hypothetical protein JJU05_17020 [Verrucomicrobia bacterium]|nr:hypothetical protein [Verrucomicrobiota bacterium]